MLILTRKPGESLYIGDDIKITIVEIKGHQIRVGIDAPRDFRIYREEIYLQILEENRQAAEGNFSSDLEGLEGLTGWQGSGEKKSGLAVSGKLTSAQSTKPLIGESQSGASEGPDVVVKRRRDKSDE